MQTESSPSPPPVQALTAVHPQRTLRHGLRRAAQRDSHEMQWSDNGVANWDDLRAAL